MTKEIAKINPEIVIQNVDLKFDKNDIVNIGIVEYENKLQEEFKALKEAFPATARELSSAIDKLHKQVLGTDDEPGEFTKKRVEKALSKTAMGVVSKVGLKDGQYRVVYYAGMHDSGCGCCQMPGFRDALRESGHTPYHVLDGGYECIGQRDYRTPALVEYKNFRLPKMSAVLDKNGDLQVAMGFTLRGSGSGLSISAEQVIFAPASKKANVLFQNVKALYDKLRAMDARMVEVNETLRNIPKLERQLKAAMAKKIIGASPIGQELMKVMQEFNKEVQTKALPEGKK